MTVSGGQTVHVSIRPPLIGLIISMLLVALVVGSTVLTENEDIAFAIGNSLTWSAIAWAVLWFGFVKKSGHKVAGRYFLFLFVSGVIAGLLVVSYQTTQKTQMRVAAAGIESGYRAFLKGDRNIDTAPKARGEAGELERFIRSYLNTMANDQRDYEAELTGAGFESILSATNIKADPSMVEAKAKVRRAHEIVEKYRELYASRIAEGEKRIDTSGLSEFSKQRVKEGFVRGMVNNRDVITKLWDSEEAVVNEIEKAVDLLAASRGRWEISGEQISFERQADLDAFNAYLAEAQRLAAEEEAIRAKAQTTNEMKLKRLNDLGR